MVRDNCISVWMVASIRGHISVDGGHEIRLDKNRTKAKQGRHAGGLLRSATV